MGPRPSRFHHKVLLLFAIVSWLLVAGWPLGGGPALAAGTELVIVHQNDFHGRLVPYPWEGGTRGGLARIAGIVDRLREEYPGAVLWLDGGDTWHGTPLANMFSGEPVVSGFNEAGLDAMVLGNHDFNFGQDALARLAGAARFAVLSANVLRDGGTPLTAANTIIPVAGLKVGVFGLVTPDTQAATHPDNVQGLTFRDPFEVAAEQVAALRGSADLVVALTHLGVDVDLELARRVPGIDVIVGGHSHTLLEEPRRVGGTIVVQAGEHGRHVGFLRLVVADGQVVDYEGRLIPVDGTAPVHAGVASLLAAREARQQEEMQKPVGHTLVELGGEGLAVRVRETALGNLVADMVRESLGAEIALVNSGAIRGHIPAGTIRMGHVYEMLPFGGPLAGLYLTGAQVLEALEHGLAGYPQLWGGFLQVSGLAYRFDPGRPVGERVVQVVAGGEPLDPLRTYTVATSDFLANGGDGYHMLAGAPAFYRRADGPTVVEWMLRYLERHGAVAPQVEGRVVAAGVGAPARADR